MPYCVHYLRKSAFSSILSFGPNFSFLNRITQKMYTAHPSICGLVQMYLLDFNAERVVKTPLTLFGFRTFPGSFRYLEIMSHEFGISSISNAKQFLQGNINGSFSKLQVFLGLNKHKGWKQAHLFFETHFEEVFSETEEKICYGWDMISFPF